MMSEEKKIGLTILCLVFSASLLVGLYSNSFLLFFATFFILIIFAIKM